MADIKKTKPQSKKKRAMVRFSCYFCGRETIRFVSGRYKLTRVYCEKKSCEEKYKNLMHNPEAAKEYIRYRRTVQARLRNRKEVQIPRTLSRRDGRIFDSENKDLGLIVGEK